MVDINIKEFTLWALRIFLVVFGIVVIYQLLRKVFGGSWHEQLLLSIVLANFGYTFYLGNKLSKQEGRWEQFEKRFENLEKYKHSLSTT